MYTPRPRPLPAQDMSTQTIRLARGQAMQVWLPAGSLVVSNAPTARISEAPHWQAEQLRIRRTELADGQSMSFEHPGWVEIVAPRGGEVLCLRPEAQSWRRTWSSVLRLLARTPRVTPVRR